MVGIGDKTMTPDDSLPKVHLYPYSDHSFQSGDTIGIGVDVEANRVLFFVNSEFHSESMLSKAGSPPYYIMASCACCSMFSCMFAEERYWPNEMLNLLLQSNLQTNNNKSVAPSPGRSRRG